MTGHLLIGSSVALPPKGHNATDEQVNAVQRKTLHTRVGCYAISAVSMKDFQSPYPGNFFRFITQFSISPDLTRMRVSEL